MIRTYLKHGSLFEMRVIRTTEGNHGARSENKGDNLWKSFALLHHNGMMSLLIRIALMNRLDTQHKTS